MKQGTVACLCAILVAGCARPVQTARLSDAEPVAPIEQEALIELNQRRCNPIWSIAFPGLGHMCLRRNGEAFALAGLGVAEIGAAAAIALAHEDDGTNDDVPAVGAPLIALQDLWAIGIMDPIRRRQLARRGKYVPRDSLADLAIAPFNVEVLKRPSVWAGTLAFLAVAIGVTFAVDDPSSEKVGDDPELFGRRVDGVIGYPAAGLMTLGLFSHVAIAEELIFRGWLQSTVARHHGETMGWGVASLAFGMVHLGNLAALDRSDWDEYVMYGMPIITAAGFYLGWQYRREGYTLAPPVAVHFWYDTLLSAVAFAIDPDDSVFTTRISLPL